MSNVIIDRDKIDILANAISAKSGEELPLTLTEMVEAVDGIEQGGGEPNLQAKTYTVDSAGTATVTADSGYDGLSSVSVSVPSAEPFAGIEVGGFYTESNVYKWRLRATTEVNESEGDTAGYLPDGTYKTGAWKSYNAVPNLTSITPTESAQSIGGTNYHMAGAVTVKAIPSNYVGSGITQRSSSDLTASGATVTVPSGYYSVQASKTVASGTAGTPTATKGSVSNHSVSVTPSVTNTAGYISGGTINGTAVTVTASELASGNKAITENGSDIDVVGYSTVSVAVPSSGGVTVTDEANATGITCVITSGGSPTPSGIPLNTELIDFTKLTEDYAINSAGEAVSAQWYCASDYTAVDPSMTFSYTGCTWYYIGVYNSSKEVVRTIYMYSDGTPDPDNNNLSSGTLSGSELTGASYVRITGVAVQSQYSLSLIRTA